MPRDIISLKRWNELVENGVIIRFKTKYGDVYRISLSEIAAERYVHETVGKIEEKDYSLTAIDCTDGMFHSYVRLVGMTVTVDDEDNPYESKYKFYVPEWMFEDRQKDLDDLYRRYEEE